MSQQTKRRKTVRQPVSDVFEHKLKLLTRTVSVANTHNTKITSFIPTFSLAHVNKLLCTPSKLGAPLCSHGDECFAVQTGLSKTPFMVWMSEQEYSNMTEFKIMPRERRLCVVCEAKRVVHAYHQSLLSEFITEVNLQRFSVSKQEFRETIPYATHMYSNTTCFAATMFVPDVCMFERKHNAIQIVPKSLKSTPSCRRPDLTY